MSFYYAAYGLTIRASFSLPELLLKEEVSDDRVDVILRKGRCDIPIRAKASERYGLIRDGSATFYWRDIGSFQIRNRDIVVEPEKGVADDLLRPFLLGPILAVFLHLRGLLVLHCSAAALYNANGALGIVAFLGHSGMGKSTTATALKRRGHLIVSDDIIAVPIPHDSFGAVPETTQAAPTIFAGPPYLKLRPPSLETFGESSEELALWHKDSYVIQHANHIQAPPLPLRCLYVLEDAEQVDIEAMEPQDALMALANNSYCVRSLDASEVALNFFQCSWLVQNIPIFRLRRPRDFAQLPMMVKQLEAHQLLF